MRDSRLCLRHSSGKSGRRSHEFVYCVCRSDSLSNTVGFQGGTTISFYAILDVLIVCLLNVEHTLSENDKVWNFFKTGKYKSIIKEEIKHKGSHLTVRIPQQLFPLSLSRSHCVSVCLLVS